MFYHDKSIKEVLDKTATREEGLTEKEALIRLQEYGPNTIKEEKKDSLFQIFLRQFNSVLIYILIAATIISWLLKEKVDAYVILAIILFNSIFGFIQEYKADKAIEHLRKLTLLKAKVVRDGHTQIINSTDIVIGDIIILEAGDKVPADLRIIEANNLKSDESPLTGESAAINKLTSVLPASTTLADRKNMLYSATSIVRGTAKAVVVNTGMNTQIGQIASLVQKSKKQKTPLEKKLREFSNVLGYVIGIICVLILGIGIIRGADIFEMFLTSIALAVAAVPEGLPAIVTISLGLGVQRMAKRNALIRRLNSIETLGALTVICSDKTGTMTKNEMTVTKIYANQEYYQITGRGYNSIGEFLDLSNKKIDIKNISKLLEAAISCNNATESSGDPTEKALLYTALKGKVKKLVRNGEIPFDSDTKFMATKHEGFDYYKGAPEIILDMCTHILINNKARRILPKDRKNILKANEDMALSALRVLGMSYKKGKEMYFLGLMGMIDPPKEGVKEALEKCKEAGIRTIMITGDHPITAKAIALKVNMDGNVISGSELEKLDDEQLKLKISEYNIYARVTSTQKVRILKALQKKGEIVAMTGDGINDAAAIKNSNVGISMSLRGTDISRDASDVVLTDDNFSSIVNAVEEGRIIYDNIKKFIIYLLSANIAEVAIILFAIMIGLPLPLLPLQILWVNLMTDSWPALALGVDPPNNDVMKRKPRDSNKHIMHKSVGFISVRGIIGTVITLGIFTWALEVFSSIEEARTVALTTLILFELVVVYSVKSEKPFNNMLNNMWLNLAVTLSLILQIFAVYSPLNKLFKLTPLSGSMWILMLGCAFVGFLCMELYKYINQRNITLN